MYTLTVFEERSDIIKIFDLHNKINMDPAGHTLRKALDNAHQKMAQQLQQLELISHILLSTVDQKPFQERFYELHTKLDEFLIHFNNHCGFEEDDFLPRFSRTNQRRAQVIHQQHIYLIKQIDKIEEIMWLCNDGNGRISKKEFVSFLHELLVALLPSWISHHQYEEKMFYEILESKFSSDEKQLLLANLVS